MSVSLPHLSAWRRYKALSQETLAALAQVGRTTIISAEQGRPVRFSTWNRLARALGIQPHRLLRPPPD